MGSGSFLPKILTKQHLVYGKLGSSSKNQQDLRQKLEKSSEKTGQDKQAVSSSITAGYQQRSGDLLEKEFSLIASDLNRRQLQIKQVRNDLQSERKILKKLKKAYQNEDSEKIAKVQDDLLALKIVQKERHDQVIREQQISGDIRSVKLGENEKASFKFPIIESKAVISEIPGNQDQIDQEYYRIEKEEKLLSGSEQSVEHTRAELSLIFRQIKHSSRDLFKSAPESIEGAMFLAENISEQARFLSPAEIIRAAFGKAEDKELSINISLLT